MRKVIVVVVAAIAVLVLVFGGLVLFVYLTNRTTDQTLATKFSVSGEWIEIIPDPPLTKTRQVQEIDFEIVDYKHDPNERLPDGQVRLPNGKIISPQIEAYDELGNRYEFRQTGYTMSRKDLVVYRPTKDLPEEVQLTRLRIRSDEPFICETLFWRNRNPK